MKHIKEQLEKLRIDATYEKKAHYNASARKLWWNNFISSSLIVVGAITGTTILDIIIDDRVTSKIVALALAILVTILSSLQKALDLEKQSQGNNVIADNYLMVVKETDLTLNLIKDDMLSTDEIIKRTENTISEMGRIRELARSFSTSSCDYKKAKSGIESGEESYSIKDREMGSFEKNKNDL